MHQRTRLTFRFEHYQHIAYGGFTLTEMLVATALVVLIMTMFAQIYGTALGTIREQRGMANNDQKARVFSEVVRNDLEHMTFRQARPEFSDGVRGLRALTSNLEPEEVDSDNERGYLYISENRPGDDTDDVLQFTVEIGNATSDIWSHEGDEAGYFGRARFFGPPPPEGPNPRNQPHFDGAFGSGKSQAAEIAYFLRDGNLYRRVLLIREPPAYVLDRTDVQPRFNNGRRVFRNDADNPQAANYRFGSNNFWTDFDYAATRRTESMAPDGVLWFHGTASLANNQGRSNDPIALPEYRFGHFNSLAFPPHHGTPREFADDYQTAATFFGRLTLGEATHSTMGWPGRPVQPVHPFLRADEEADLHSWIQDVNNPINAQEEQRTGDDILLSGVTAFDIKVKLTGWIDFDDLPLNTQNPGYGPRSSGNRVFDTWHPEARSPGNNENPPQALALEAIQITVRFEDVHSGMPRQVTVVHSFVE